MTLEHSYSDDHVLESFADNFSTKLALEMGDKETSVFVLQNRSDTLAPYTNYAFFLVSKLRPQFGQLNVDDAYFDKIEDLCADNISEVLSRKENRILIIFSNGLEPMWSNGKLHDFCDAMPEGTHFIWIHPWSGLSHFTCESNMSLVKSTPNVKGEDKGLTFLTLSQESLDKMHLIGEESRVHGRGLRVPKEWQREPKEHTPTPLDTPREAFSFYQRCGFPFTVKFVLGVISCFPKGELSLPFLTSVLREVELKSGNKEFTHEMVSMALASGVLKSGDAKGVTFQHRTQPSREVWFSMLGRSIIAEIMQIGLKLHTESPKELDNLGLDIPNICNKVLKGEYVGEDTPHLNEILMYNGKIIGDISFEKLGGK